MTYVYKGRGFVQATGKQRRNMSQSSIYTTQSHIAALGSGSVTLGSNGNAWSGSSIPPLTIQGLTHGNGYQYSSINIFPDRNIASDVKKYEIYESPEDILALSVAWKRLRKNGVSLGISTMLERQVFERLTPEDRETANLIRDYYSKKIMMWKLKGKELTSFRKDLNIFVHEEGTKFKTEMIGLAYYLPEFYAYDSEIDTVREQVKSKGLVTGQDKTLLPLTSMLGPKSKKLTPLKRINRVNKKINHMQYWFKDDETEGAVVINIDSKNPLEHIWNNVFDNSDTLNVKGKYYLKDNEDFEYFSIKNWELEKG